MFKDVQKKIGDVQRVIGLVEKASASDIASSAVNDTAFYCRIKTIEFMRQNFDEPVGRTLSSTLIKPLATPNNLTAKIYINDDKDKGNRPSDWLAAQVTGGTRRNKRMEMGLKLAGILPDSMHVRGMKGAMNDAGNLPGGKVKQMLSALNAGNDATQDSKDAGKKAKWRIARRKGDGKAFGIFQMQGVHSKLFLIFTRKQKYKARYPFHQIIQKAWNEKIKEAYQRRFFERVGQVIGSGIK